MKRCIACGRSFAGDAWACPACGAVTDSMLGHPVFAPALATANSGFRPELFRELAQLEATNFWFRARNRLIVWAMRRYFPSVGDFLEIGCGTGFVLQGIAEAFPGARLSGSEIFIEALEMTRTRVPRATLFQMDARRIPFEREFDIVGAFDVLEHIHEDDEVLAEIHRALVPGGGLVLTVPQHAFLWSQQDEHACHVRRYERDALTGQLRRAGFDVVTAVSFVSLLLPLMLVSRWRKGKAAGPFDPLSELRLGGVANRLLERTLDLERLIIRYGGSLPWGGSLLVVARRRGESS